MTLSSNRMGSGRRRGGTDLPRVATVLATMLVLAALPASAWVDLGDQSLPAYVPSGAYVLDGSYVMNVGELHINITNWGLIGSHYSSATTYSDAPSAQWPAGSGNEYLWAAGLWVGGIVLGEALVSTGQYQREFWARDDPEDTIYEAINAVLVRPAGNTNASGRRFPEPNPNDDDDTDEFGNPRIDEEILNGYDDDEDGEIDEDFGQIGNQMMVATMYDNTRLASELYPDHTPLNIEVIQESFAWENDQVDDFVGFQYTITNVGVTDIANVYIGFFADADIGPRGQGGTASDDMAGSFRGAVRASDGGWVPVQVGFMYDAAEDNRLEGYFGIAFLSHATDPTGRTAPPTVSLRTFQRFSGQAPFNQGGDPTNDAERYELMSADEDEYDDDVQPGKQEDFRFMISAGPFEVLEPDGQLEFQVAMVAGPGRDGLLRHCADAMLTWYGNWFDIMPDYPSDENPQITIVTGENGRETMVCREDFLDPADFDQLYPDFGDQSCVGQEWLLQNADPLQPEEIFIYERKHCTMVNFDTCFECFRQKPHAPNELPSQSQCTEADIETYWNCGDPEVPAFQKAGCTGVGGNETQVNWLVGMAPPPPGMRVWPTDNRVHVFWNNESETSLDVRLNAIDFQSYRVWRADNWTRPYGSSLDNGPGSNLWQLIAEYDVVDSFIVDYEVGPEEVVSDTLPLGPNTGLDVIRYTPRVLDTQRYPEFIGLADSMQVVVDADPEGRFDDRPTIYDREGQVNPIMTPVLQWQGYPDVLDTFWAVTPREEVTVIDPDSGNPVITVVGKDAVEFYEYVDNAVHNGFIYFYSVTATDHELELLPDGSFRIVGAGLSGDPSSSFTNSTPATDAQSAAEREAEGANIFVYPNPATREALADFQELFPSGDDPTGVRVSFANLPRARNTIKIYTLSGDLVETIEHDGSQGYGEATWNLISRNGQEVVSGIYMYVVQSDDDRFDDFIGKFVVVR